MTRKPIESIGVLTSVALAVQLACLPTVASAQDTASAEKLVLDEIIVTAQRREQNIQDIPLSVSAISASSLSDGGVLDISRLKLLVPGMNFGQTGVYAHVAVRGARTEAIQVNTQPIISSYSDGIYRSGTEQFLGPMLDINRVEVLRGPQGTLFGRNSYGGAIAVHTNRPSQEFDASIKYTGGDYSQSDIYGMINFPLGDTVSARVVAAHFEHDGYVTNVFPDGPGGIGADMNDQDDDYIRGALLFEFDNASLILRGEHFERGGAGTGDFQGSTAGSMDPLCIGPFCALGGVQGGTPAGDVFDVALPFNTNSSCSTFYLSAFPYDAVGRCDQSDTTDPYTVNYNGPIRLQSEQNTFSAEFNGEYGWGNMKLLAAYTENESLHQGDGYVGPGDVFVSGEYVTRETTQVEVHFTDNGEGDTSWLVGAFYLDESNHDNFFFVSSTAAGSHYTFFCASDRDVQATSTAVFGEVTFAVSDSTRITAGARYSHEENDWVVNSFYEGGGDFEPPHTQIYGPDFLSYGVHDRSGAPFAPDPANDVAISDTFEPITWRLAVAHDVSEDTLIYGSVATGYASGGFNSSQDPHTAEFTFEEQDSIAYEVGYKATLLDGAMTLNVAAFYNDYKEFTAEPATIVGTAVIVYNRVGGDAEAVGIDLEMDWIPAENWLVNLRASVLNAEYGNFVTGLGGNVATAGDQFDPYVSVGTPEWPAGEMVPQMRLDGKQIAFSPDFTFGLTASYDIELGGAGTLTPLLQFYYSSDYSASDQGYLHGLQDSYSQTAVRLTWTSGDGRWNISGFVHNLEDEAVVVRANIFGASQATQQFAPPRTWGVSVGYNHR